MDSNRNKTKACRLLVGGILLLLLQAACSTAGDNRAHRAPLPGYIAVPLRRSSQNELLLDARINGVPAVFLIDTGAPHVAIEQARINSFGVQPLGGNTPLAPTVQANGQIHRVTVLSSLQIGGINLEHVPAVLIDIAAVAVPGRPANARTSDGILGLDALTALNAVVDCAKPELLIRNDSKSGAGIGPIMTATGWKEVAMSTAHGHFTINAVIDNAPATMVVDTGSGLSVLDIRFTEAHRMQLSARTFASAGIHFRSNTARALRLNRLKLGGYPVNDSVALVFNLSDLLSTASTSEAQGVNGLLGAQTLAEADAVIDCKARKFYLRPKTLRISYSLGGS